MRKNTINFFKVIMLVSLSMVYSVESFSQVKGDDSELSVPRAVIGISGPSGGDDTPMLQSKIDSAVQAGHRTVYLSAGVYNLKSLSRLTSTGSQGHLLFEGGTSISFVGSASGQTILKFWNSNKSGLIVSKTRNFVLQNIILDYQYPPHGQGTVTSIDKNNRNIWVSNDSGYETWNSALFNPKNIHGVRDKTLYVTRTNRGQTPAKCDLLPDSSSDVNSGFANGQNWFRYQSLDSCLDGISVGQKVILNPVYYDALALHLQQTEGAIILNSRIYRSPGVAILIDHTKKGDAPFDQILVDGLIIMFSPEPTETDREISTNADGIHILGARSAITIQNSFFYGMSDDAINAHVRSALVLSVFMSGSTPILKYQSVGGFADFEIGDWVEVFNPSRKVTACGANVVSKPYSFPQEPAVMYVNLSSQAANCIVSEGYNNTNSSTADWVSNVNEAGGSGPLTIKNNFFYANRGRAILNRWWNSSITDNLIGSTEYGWPSWRDGIREGFCPGDLSYPEGLWVFPGRDQQVIRGNTGVLGNKISGCF